MLCGAEQVKPNADTGKARKLDIITTRDLFRRLGKGNADLVKLGLITGARAGSWEPEAEAWAGGW